MENFYLDVDNFVDEWDQMNYDPDEDREFEITPDGEWSSANGYDDYYDDDEQEVDEDQNW